MLAAFPQAPPCPTALTLLSPGIISHCSLLLPTTVCQNISTGTQAQLKPKLLPLLFFDLKVLCTQYTNIDVVITYPNCAGTHKPVLALCGATPSTYWLVMVGRLKIGRPLCCHSVQNLPVSNLICFALIPANQVLLSLFETSGHVWQTSCSRKAIL